jgi:hypothetical protein
MVLNSFDAIVEVRIEVEYESFDLIVEVVSAVEFSLAKSILCIVLTAL